MRKFFLLSLWAVLFSSTLSATTYTVTNTNDSGTGSLRYAMQMCVGTTGPHTIEFNIPTTDANYQTSTGVWVISPSSDLPILTNVSVLIDGTSQTAAVGNTNPEGPEIVLDGQNVRNYGFRFLQSPNCALKGLNIRQFTKGAQFYESTNCSVTGCYIGVDEVGNTAMGNDIGLEFISGSDNAVIGGNTVADRNIVSGNQHIGIRLLDVQHCVVSGNLIGTDRTGTQAVPNYDGMSMEGAVQSCTIGGTLPGARNVISGNTDYGLPLFGVGATGNTIIGNYIGTDITGTRAIGNTYGVLFDDGAFGNVVGGDSDAERNIISGNVGYGVFFYNNGTNNNILKNNYIGTDVTGKTAVPNTSGIIIDGISYKNWMDGNVISGNAQMGIGINITASDSNVIVRNRIGVDIDGDPLPNGMDGIRISQGPRKTVIGGTPEEGNIIAHNGGCGIYITNHECTQNLISGNSFYQNAGLAIDLFAPGVNANDEGDDDEGANGLLNYPEITGVGLSCGAMRIVGVVDTRNPQQCEIQIYKSDPDPTGFGEGMTYLCSATPDMFGGWSVMLLDGREEDYYTALTIDPQHNTSEFSRARNAHGLAGIHEAQTDPGFIVFPNPASEFVTVRFPAPVCTYIELLNANGERLYATEFNGTETTIDLSTYAPGAYIIRAANTNRLFIHQ
jgi:hypothetical protein